MNVGPSGGFNPLSLFNITGLAGELVEKLVTDATGNALLGDLAAAGVDALLGNYPAAVLHGLEAAGDVLEQAFQDPRLAKGPVCGRQVAATCPGPLAGTQGTSAYTQARRVDDCGGEGGAARGSSAHGAHHGSSAYGAHRGEPAHGAHHGHRAESAHRGHRAESAHRGHAAEPAYRDSGYAEPHLDVQINLPIFGLVGALLGHVLQLRYCSGGAPAGHAPEGSPPPEVTAGLKTTSIASDPSLSLSAKVATLLGGVMDGLEKRIEGKLAEVEKNPDDEKLKFELQSLMQSRSQMMSLASNLLNMMHQASMQVIGNVR